MAFQMRRKIEEADGELRRYVKVSQNIELIN